MWLLPLLLPCSLQLLLWPLLHVLRDKGSSYHGGCMPSGHWLRPGRLCAAAPVFGTGWVNITACPSPFTLFFTPGELRMFDRRTSVALCDASCTDGCVCCVVRTALSFRGQT